MGLFVGHAFDQTQWNQAINKHFMNRKWVIYSPFMEMQLCSMSHAIFGFSIGAASSLFRASFQVMISYWNKWFTNDAHPTMVPTPTSVWTATPATEVKSSGADEPAAMKVAPATSSERRSFSEITSRDGTKKSSHTMAKAEKYKCKHRSSEKKIEWILYWETKHEVRSPYVITQKEVQELLQRRHLFRYSILYIKNNAKIYAEKAVRSFHCKPWWVTGKNH